MITRNIESGSFIPHARDKNEIIAEFLKNAPQGSVLDPNPKRTGADLDSDSLNPIVTVEFINDPPTRRSLDDFLQISIRQTQADRERNRRGILPRSGVIFRRNHVFSRA